MVQKSENRLNSLENMLDSVKPFTDQLTENPDIDEEKAHAMLNDMTYQCTKAMSDFLESVLGELAEEDPNFKNDSMHDDLKQLMGLLNDHRQGNCSTEDLISKTQNFMNKVDKKTKDTANSEHWNSN